MRKIAIFSILFMTSSTLLAGPVISRSDLDTLLKYTGQSIVEWVLKGKPSEGTGTGGTSGVLDLSRAPSETRKPPISAGDKGGDDKSGGDEGSGDGGSGDGGSGDGGSGDEGSGDEGSGDEGSGDEGGGDEGGGDDSGWDEDFLPVQGDGVTDPPKDSSNFKASYRNPISVVYKKKDGGWTDPKQEYSDSPISGPNTLKPLSVSSPHGLGVTDPSLTQESRVEIGHSTGTFPSLHSSHGKGVSDPPKDGPLAGGGGGGIGGSICSRSPNLPECLERRNERAFLDDSLGAVAIRPGRFGRKNLDPWINPKFDVGSPRRF